MVWTMMMPPIFAYCIVTGYFVCCLFFYFSEQIIQIYDEPFRALSSKTWPYVYSCSKVTDSSIAHTNKNAMQLLKG